MWLWFPGQNFDSVSAHVQSVIPKRKMTESEAVPKQFACAELLALLISSIITFDQVYILYVPLRRDDAKMFRAGYAARKKSKCRALFEL